MTINQRYLAQRAAMTAILARQHTIHTDARLEHSIDDTKIRRPLSAAFHPSVFSPSENEGICSICLGLPLSPVSLRKCGHIFCEQCIRQHLVTYNEHDRLPIGTAKCPVDRVTFTATSILDFVDWPHVLRKLWNTMVVECDHPCDFTGSPDQYMTHRNSVHCQKRGILCPGQECRVIGPASVVANHVENCRHVVVYCVACRYPVKYRDLAQHICPEACFGDVPQGMGGELADIASFRNYAANTLRGTTRSAFVNLLGETRDSMPADDPAIENQIEEVLRPIVASATTGDPSVASIQLEESIRGIIEQFEHAEERIEQQFAPPPGRASLTGEDPPTFESTRTIVEALGRADQRLAAFERARTAVAAAAMWSTTPRANRYREGRGRRTVAEQPDDLLVAPRNSRGGGGADDGDGGEGNGGARSIT